MALPLLERAWERAQRHRPGRAWDSLWLAAAFLLYAAWVIVLAAHHEPWFDEAQAWLLARDATPRELFTTYLRCEGSPGLWHLVLMVPAKLHLPYAALHVVAAVFAIAGVAVLLRYAPFPLPIKLLLPFSFVLGYQYAVVARSYVMLPLLLFLAAAAYRQRLTRVYLYALPLAFLANASLHGALIAYGLLAVHAVQVFIGWRGLSRAQRWQQVAVFAFFGVMFAGLLYTLWPPADLPANLAHNTFSLRAAARTSLTTFANVLGGTPFLAVPVVLVSLWWFRRRGVLWLYLAPTLLLLALFSIKFCRPWHEGTLFLVWLFALWQSFAGERGVPAREFSPARPVVLAAVAIVLAVQLYWGVGSARYEVQRPYSAAETVARYLQRRHLTNASIYAQGFNTVGILPYFDRNLFLNMNGGHKPCYWVWTRPDDLGALGPGSAFRKADPDVLIIGLKYGLFSYIIYTETSPYIQQRYTGREFDAYMCVRGAPGQQDGFMVYEKRRPAARGSVVR